MPATPRRRGSSLIILSVSGSREGSTAYTVVVRSVARRVSAGALAVEHAEMEVLATIESDLRAVVSYSQTSPARSAATLTDTMKSASDDLQRRRSPAERSSTNLASISASTTGSRPPYAWRSSSG